MRLSGLLAQAPRFAAFCILALMFCTPVAAITPPQPGWKSLSPQQQEALKPLAGEWDKIDHFRRKKWLTLAEKFPSMKPEEQKRVQGRMAGWAKLTPEQRRAARENYQQAKALPPEQKKAEWQQYQKLPDAQKQNLAAAADAKKPVKQKQQRRAQQAESTQQAAGKAASKTVALSNGIQAGASAPGMTVPLASGAASTAAGTQLGTLSPAPAPAPTALTEGAGK